MQESLWIALVVGLVDLCWGQTNEWNPKWKRNTPDSEGEELVIVVDPERVGLVFVEQLEPVDKTLVAAQHLSVAVCSL